MRIAAARIARSRRKARLSTCAALATLALMGCAPRAIEPHPALMVPIEDFKSRVTMLCLREIDARIELVDADSKKARLEELITEALREIGFEVVDSEPVEALWEELLEEAGGIYDVHWGSVLGSRRDEVSDRFYAETSARLGCGAVVHTQIVEVDASLWNGAADWDNASMLGTYGLVGYLPAISLRITIRDAREHDLYYGVGGIHLGVALEQDEYTDPHYERVEPERHLAEESEIVRAIRLALDPLDLRMAEPDR